MSSLFSPKVPSAIIPPNPGDTQNRINDALSRQLQSGGTNADTLPGSGPATVGPGRLPTLTGLNG